MNELLPERSSRDARPQQRWSWRDGWRVRPRGGRISSYWKGTGRQGAQNSKYFKMIGDINSRLILSYTL